MKVTLRPVTQNDIEFLRVNRNEPMQYRYFRQDRPLTKEDQLRWWRSMTPANSRLFIVVNDKGRDVGYVGFQPFKHYALSAEFGIFICTPDQKQGYGKAALKELLRHGFMDLNLANIYSDCLEYPKEDRFGFYKKIGFVPYSDACQNRWYTKQGKRVPSTKFYMTKDRYLEVYGQDSSSGLGAIVGKLAGLLPKREAEGQRLHPGA